MCTTRTKLAKSVEIANDENIINAINTCTVYIENVISSRSIKSMADQFQLCRLWYGFGNWNVPGDSTFRIGDNEDEG